MSTQKIIKRYISAVMFSALLWTYPTFGSPVIIELERSLDLQSWDRIEITQELLDDDGAIVLESGESSEFFRLRIRTTEDDDLPDDLEEVHGGSLPAVSDLGEVEVDSFYIGRFEVTWSQWQTVREWAQENGYDLSEVGDGCDGDHPVHSVSWHDAVKWCNARSEIEGLTPVYTVDGSVYRTGIVDDVDWNSSGDGYRLPTEAEWEYAARGGNESQGYTYSGSDELGEVGWYLNNTGDAACDLSHGRGTWPVGMKNHNEIGLYDMSGNVWEWCWDGFETERGFYRQIRGGAWTAGSAYHAMSRRESISAKAVGHHYGFRVARDSQ